MGVIEFWDDIYLPHVEKNKRTSTVRGYKAIWDQHLKDHFTGYALGEYRTHYGTALLNSLTAHSPPVLAACPLARIRPIQPCREPWIFGGQPMARSPGHREHPRA